ncbi:MAG: CDGSH iron-sulfur domain-containing protein [Rhodospirillales bacterium]|nr:CDGSH iron-sulfur domain-containing protein [Rhodospirillales bacterium]
MATPKIADTSPIQVELEKGKRYFFCTCGQSGQQPFCDGSHAGTEFTPLAFEAEKDGPAWLCACKHSAKQPFCDGAHKPLRDA